MSGVFLLLSAQADIKSPAEVAVSMSSPHAFAYKMMYSYS